MLATVTHASTKGDPAELVGALVTPMQVTCNIPVALKAPKSLAHVGTRNLITEHDHKSATRSLLHLRFRAGGAAKHAATMIATGDSS